MIQQNNANQSMADLGAAVGGQLFLQNKNGDDQYGDESDG